MALPTALALVPVGLAASSLLAVSGGDRTAFFALAHTLDVTAILVSSYAWTLPELVFALFIFWVYRYHPISDPKPAREHPGTILVWFPVLVADLLFLPHPRLLLAPLIALSVLLLTYLCWPGLLVGPFTWLKSKTFFVDAWRGIPPVALLGWVAGAAMVVAINGTMWIPPEVLDVKDEEVGTGYVLEEKEDEVLVFWHDGRGIKRYAVDTIVYRQFCHFAGEPDKIILARAIMHSPQTVKKPMSQECA